MTFDEIVSLLSRTEELMKAGEYLTGELSAREAVDILSSTSNTNTIFIPAEERAALLSRANRLVSVSLLKCGRAKEALPFALQSLTHASLSGNKNEEAKANGAVGSAYFNVSDYRKALEFQSIAYEAHTALGNDAEAARVLGNMGIVYQYIADFPRALESYQQALATHQALGMEVDSARMIGNIGMIYFSLGDYPHALIHYKHALNSYMNLGMNTEIASLRCNIGNVYQALSDYQSALQEYNSVVPIFEKSGNNGAKAIVLSNIANIYSDFHDFPRALEYNHASLSIHTELGNTASAAKVLSNIGNIYLGMNDYPSALTYYTQALTIHENLSMQYDIARLYEHLGEVYYFLKDYTIALEYFRSSLAKNNELNNIAGVAKTKGILGAWYADKHYPGYDAGKAENYLLEAITLHESLDAKRNLYENHYHISNLYEQEGELTKALYHSKVHHRIYTEVQNEEVKKQADKFGWERSIATMEKEHTIERLRTESEKKLLEETIQLQKRTLDSQAYEVEYSIQELVKKNSLLHHIQVDIKKIIPHVRCEGVDQIHQLLDRVSRHISPIDSVHELDRQWTVIHSCFIKKLQYSFPDLTTMELKIAVLLNMKFTTSNIGTALFLSKRTVEFHRHNLRKKMGICASDDIYAALSGFNER